MKKEKFKKGQIVFSQGWWKCKIVEDFGASVSYIPLEGMPDSDKGETFIASKDLFLTKKIHQKRLIQ